MAQIIYTITDEAPALASRSFLPIVSSFLEPYGISLETKNISLASRILSAFQEYISEQPSDRLGKSRELANDQF